jgi:hypothetical protein
MPVTVPTWKIASWDEFEARVWSLPVGTPFDAACIFRGHADATWKLLPSLARQARVFDLSEEATLRIEYQAWGEFKTLVHLHLPPAMLVPDDERIHWWAVMQHYGVPTRLLDWTASPYVAAYFAVDTLSPVDGAVWYFRLPDAAELAKCTETRRRWTAPPVAPYREFFEPGAKASLLFTTLNFQTDRMRAQQTRFSVSTQVLANHLPLLADMMSGRPWGQIIIPHALKPEFSLRLTRMNITAQALFPGIDGLGRSIAALVSLTARVQRGHP